MVRSVVESAVIFASVTTRPWKGLVSVTQAISFAWSQACTTTRPVLKVGGYA